MAGRDVPIVLPSWDDPRLHVAAVLVTIQVLGQTVLGFELSVAQILVSVLTCGAIEVGLVLWRRRMIVWPASALLTGNGVALILRVPGTRHGDWWSLVGAGIFAATAAIALLSKHVIRWRGRHVLNPSNIGLVSCFLLLGTRRANPQDLWWGPVSLGLVVTFLVIIVGGVVVVRRQRMLDAVVAFWVTFAACLGVIAASGHCMTARWHVGPVCGWSFWWVLVTSPEILVFVFFMITDPRTAPSGRVARSVYGVSVALVAALLMAPQRTEFATKLAVLGGLTVVCAARPLLERVLPAPGSVRDHPLALLSHAPTGALRVAIPGLFCLGCLAIGTALFVAGAPASATSEAFHLAVQATDRPVVPSEPSTIPTPSIDGSARTIDPPVDAAAARRMTEDLVADLAIASDALRRGDRNLAARSGTGEWLRGIQSEIVSARRGTVVVPTYRFDRLEVLLVRDPTDPQAPPGIGIRATGREGRLGFVGTAASAPIATEDVPFHRTFVLVRAGGHYLIAADAPA